MRLQENRPVAWAVLAVCVLLSVFGLGGSALGRERSKVMKVFNDGTNASTTVRSSMDAYLDSAAENATIMANEAEMRLGESELTRGALANAKLIGEDSASLDARYSAYTSLKDQVEKLYNNLYSALSPEEFKAFKLAYDDFWGCDDMIKRDDYHKLAKGYNDLISGFPGGMVATLTGSGTLNTFGG